MAATSESIDRIVEAMCSIAVQLDCPIPEAFDWLLLSATEFDQSIEQTALDVLDGLIRVD